MLNRTNRMLTANLNRLNLGTRSLASREQVRFNDGTQTRHTRHASAVVMRAGRVVDPVDPMSIPIGSCVILSFPGSPSVSPWLIASYAIQPRVAHTLFTTDSLPGNWPVSRFDQPCFQAEEPGSRPTRHSKGRGKAGAG
jgi:hypothetical protein